MGSASEDQFEATCDRRLEEAGSDLAQSPPSRIGACFLKMTHARIAALPAAAPRQGSGDA